MEGVDMTAEEVQGLQELCKDIDINQFPATFTLEEQGQFAIGYYHQRQKQFSSSARNKT